MPSSEKTSSEKTSSEKTSSEKTSSQETNARPGYTYAASFGQPNGEQFVRVKLEINGHVQVVPVCALCHKAFRLCSLDPSVTEEQINSAKYLGLADGTGQDSDHTGSSDKKDAKDSTEKKDSKDSVDSKDSKDAKPSTDSHDSKDDNKNKESGKTEEEKKKKKKWDYVDQRRKTLPNTEWHTNKSSEDEWKKKKKKDYQ